MELKYQTKGIERLGPDRPCLFTKYGSGKTEIILRRLAKLLDHQKHGGYLAMIFCQKKNVSTWQREIARLYPSWCVGVADQTGHITVKSDPTTWIVLVEHHKIAKQVDNLIHHRPKALVMDESTVIKNPEAQITKAALRIAYANANQDCLRLIMSGDPKPENETELWSQFQFCFGPDKNPLGMTYYGHLRHWFLKPDWHYILKDDKATTFYSIVRNHSVLFDEEDHQEFRRAKGELNLVYKMHQYEPTQEQRDLLAHLDKTWALPTSSGTDEEYEHNMSILQKRQQIANGFYYTGPQTKRVEEYLPEQPKAALLADRVQHWHNQGHIRLVVWHHYQAERAIITAYIHGPRIECLSTSNTDLQRFLYDEKQQPKMETVEIKTLVLVANSSVARGINEIVMAGASVGIWYSNSYKQEIRNQQEARFDRLGQKDKTIVFEDLTSTDLMDRQLLTALWAKELTNARINAIVTNYYGDLHAR